MELLSKLILICGNSSCMINDGVISFPAKLKANWIIHKL